MTHLNNPQYLILTGDLPAPNLLHDNRFPITAAFDKLHHLHGTSPAACADQLTLEQPIIAH